MPTRFGPVLAFSLCLVHCGSTAQPQSGADATLVVGQNRLAARAALNLRNAHPDNAGKALCADVKDLSEQNGARVQIWECTTTRNQLFLSSGSLLKVYGSKCLDVVDGVNQDGTEVQIWDCNANDAAQQWEWVGNNLRWKNTDKCLDVTNGAFSNGTLLQVWTCNYNSSNQSFALASSSTATTSASSATTSSTTTSTSSGTTSSSATSPSVSGATVLDLSKWTQEVHPAGAFNNEQENYTDNGANVSFVNGVTTITAKPTGGSGWSSARLSGDPLGSLPVYIEASIASPTGQGTWPAFWLTARSSWPQGGEIDIMEEINGIASSNISTHWGATTGDATFNTHEVVGSGIDIAQPHRYGAYIDDNGVQFYLDGKAVGAHVAFPAEANFPSIATQMVPIVNLAMGGVWPGNAAQSVGPQVMKVYNVTRASHAP